jgi:O-methyltransferase
MFRIVGKLLTNPGHYMPLAMKVAQQPFCYLFRNCSFFLQGQMDISARSRWHDAAFVKRTGGFYPKNSEVHREICDLEPWDTTRRDMLILFLRTIIERGVQGEFAEVGVYKGFTAKLIHRYAPERMLHLFDTFEGFTSQSVRAEQSVTGFLVEEGHFADTSLLQVKKYISPINSNVFLYPGYFPESIPPRFVESRFAFVHLDADLYEPIYKGLEFFYPRMTVGGILIIHDYNAWPGARRAVDEFFAGTVEFPVPMPDKSGSALIVKQ